MPLVCKSALFKCNYYIISPRAITKNLLSSSQLTPPNRVEWCVLVLCLTPSSLSLQPFSVFQSQLLLQKQNISCSWYHYSQSFHCKCDSCYYIPFFLFCYHCICRISIRFIDLSFPSLFSLACGRVTKETDSKSLTQRAGERGVRGVDLSHATMCVHIYRFISNPDWHCHGHNWKKINWRHT